MFGKSPSGLIGTNLFANMNLYNISDVSPLGTVFFMFQLAFAGTAITIVSGAMSERIGFIPYMTASVFVGIIIYPIFGHWCWGNLFYSGNKSWMADLFAVSLVVHSVGVWVSLAGISLLGTRLRRFNSDGKPAEFKAYQISCAALGLFLLWLGW